MPEDLDIEQLLDCTLSHKADHLRAFLELRKIPKSGSKDALRARLGEWLGEEAGRAVLLTEYLNLIEGWGNQHLYLYTAPEGLCRKWRREVHVKDNLKQNGVARVLNRPRPVVLPEEPTLASVRWSDKTVRFLWNEKRTWYERREDADEEPEEGNLVLRAWERKTARGTIAFDWDLVTGAAMLMIQRLPSGAQYANIRDEMVNLLMPFVDITSFTPLRVSSSIKYILGSGEVRERKTNWETTKGGKAVFISPGRRQAVGADETLRKMEDAGKGSIQGSLGNMYWLPTKDGKLEEEIHTVLHKKDQRVGIMGERFEEEVRYVVSRIRSHCR